MGIIWKTHLTKEKAVAYAATEWYIGKTAQEIVDFQLFEERLCMPLDLFQRALEEVLGHPVQTADLCPKGWAVLQYEYISQSLTFDQDSEKQDKD